ncbi:hypothetical protein TIFTF001_014849 [Ficus carica]|uniref:Uncharacterized protein n=1 Tax=Ficus carica TaxID=3494 RepID=A0AA88D8F7_FICCA|nr:hypothetical protein TIFTF001_014849 [Ficus carica]
MKKNFQFIPKSNSNPNPNPQTWQPPPNSNHWCRPWSHRRIRPQRRRRRNYEIVGDFRLTTTRARQILLRFPPHAYDSFGHKDLSFTAGHPTSFGFLAYVVNSSESLSLWRDSSKNKFAFDSVYGMVFTKKTNQTDPIVNTPTCSAGWTCFSHEGVLSEIHQTRGSVGREARRRGEELGPVVVVVHRGGRGELWLGLANGKRLGMGIDRPNSTQAIEPPPPRAVAPTAHQLSSPSVISMDRQYPTEEGAGESSWPPGRECAREIARERRSARGVEGAGGGRMDDTGDRDG